MKKLIFITLVFTIFIDTLFASEKLENEQRKQLIIDQLSKSLLQTKDRYKKQLVQITIQCVKNSNNIDDIKSCMSSTFSNKG